MDYTKFLGKTEHVVLAYLGGAYAFGKDRRLRVDEPRPTPGFHRFEVKGRNARALEAVDSPELQDLPRARGHFVSGWIARSKQPLLEPLALLPAEEPSPFAIVRARRWHSRDLVFESLDFESEVEETARLCLERFEPLADVKGVPASLRAAYGVALALAVARRMNTVLAVREAAAAAVRVADDGEAAARAFVTDIDRHRREEAERARVRALARGAPAPPGRRRQERDVPTLDNASLRAEAALDAADARFLSSRHLGGGSLEVAFTFMGERFVSVVDAITLHVHDAGVCLAGEDDLVTLESLPAVIREAIETEALVITRR